ncbi:NAD-dependent protein deacylase [Paenibacillus sambharensis]|uniref:NAD-dependent protein deacetylase n=1 Tax=Paenibacillus sambharensis TaxID=1803190 RepID=A0A2W1LIR1_9BACL|nr:NAD-dependent protein deacylase [Paenibacillus sambharensis]PZD94464.1 NAD-dependent protein deacylase [Paenibacillus sambharensis]
MEDRYNELKQLVDGGGTIVFFGGAGVSTESHIPDFRSATGLYQMENQQAYPPERILSHSFFMEHTAQFYDFYRSKMIYRDAKPNPAHLALARLEQEGRLSAVVTQNIDGLHQAAGSRRVLELHGSVQRNYCMDCKAFYSLEDVLEMSGEIPVCSKCGGTIKPDVVLYEEMLDMDVLEEAANAIAAADILIVGGTSLTVNPAAGLVRYYPGNKLVLINQSETPYDSRARLLIKDRIGAVLGSLFN